MALQLLLQLQKLQFHQLQVKHLLVLFQLQKHLLKKLQLKLQLKNQLQKLLLKKKLLQNNYYK
jgi:hypothetical protein